MSGRYGYRGGRDYRRRPYRGSRSTNPYNNGSVNGPDTTVKRSGNLPPRFEFLRRV